MVDGATIQRVSCWSTTGQLLVTLLVLGFRLVNVGLVARVQVAVALVVLAHVHPLGLLRVISRCEMHLGAELVRAVEEHLGT